MLCLLCGHDKTHKHGKTWQSGNATAGANQWYFTPADRAMASRLRTNLVSGGREQTKVTTRLVVSYFNWIWEHTRLGDTAAQRVGFILSNLELERLRCLSHTSLMHNPQP